MAKKQSFVKKRNKKVTKKQKNQFDFVISLAKVFFFPLKIYFKIIYLAILGLGKVIQKSVIEIQSYRKVIGGLKAIFRFEVRIRVFSIKTVLFVILVTGSYVFSVFYLSILDEIPPSNKIIQFDPAVTTTIYDRRGNTLYRVHNEEDRELVSLDEIPQGLINATIAIEDQGFYQHNGLSFRGIIRASKRTVLEEDLQGGSTITQQLIKNVILSPQRTMKRKLKEAVLAIAIEKKFTKDEILEMYMNTISYGGTAHGVKSAARKYFDKNLDELTLAESAFLAALPAAPSTYSPFGSNPKSGIQRQHLVLDRMVEDGYITAGDAEAARLEKLSFAIQNDPIAAPHFVNYVLSLLEEEYGQKLVHQGGLEVYTSLDMQLQKELEKIVARNVSELRGWNPNLNGAAVITNPQTGEILAMVGSADFWDLERDGNVNVAISPRQPGSSIKPLVYSLAFEQGISPYSTVEDKPITYQIAGGRPYAPVNYDGLFHGTVTIATALANSYNVPAVKTLDRVGVSNFIDHAEQLGITTWEDRSRFGLSLTLGAGEVKMVDMAEAFGTFANLGNHVEVSPILKVYDPYGQVLGDNACIDFLDEPPSFLTRKIKQEISAMAANGFDYKDFDQEVTHSCMRQKVIEPINAYYINSILSDNRGRAPAFGANSALNITKKQVAVKTGTTQNLRDNWAIGYTDNYLVAAWVGNNHNEPMSNVVSGYRGASIIWRDTFDYLIEQKDIPDQLSQPSNIIEVQICTLTGTLPCQGCPTTTQIFLKGTEPTTHCDPEYIKKLLGKDEKEEESDNDENDD